MDGIFEIDASWEKFRISEFVGGWQITNFTPAKMYQALLILSFFACAAFSFFLNKVLLRHAAYSGKKGGIEEERWGSRTKPTIGGISFFITFVLSGLVMILVGAHKIGVSSDFLALVITSTLGFLLGLQDDAYSTRPFLKLGGQILCGVVMILFGVTIDLTHIPILDYALTLFWVVGIMNAVNLLDNMDAVTGTVSLAILLSTIVLLTLFREVSGAFFFSMVAVSGAIVGFLILNWNPSKLYMGDTGSQFLGAFLAFIGIKFLWNIQLQGTTDVTAIKIFAPVMAFIVPIMDTSFVTFFRMWRGSSPFVGGRDHLTHYLTFVGVSERMVPLVLGTITILSGGLMVFSGSWLPKWNYVFSAVFGAYIVIAVAIFLGLYIRGMKVSKLRAAFKKRKELNDLRQIAIEAREKINAPVN